MESSTSEVVGWSSGGSAVRSTGIAPALDGRQVHPAENSARRATGCDGAAGEMCAGDHVEHRALAPCDGRVDGRADTTAPF